MIIRSLAGSFTSLKEYLDRRFYPGIKNNWDDKLLREAVLEYLKKDMIILDLGAGLGEIPYLNFKGLASKVCGVDIDPAIYGNKFLDEVRLAKNDEIPYPDGTFNIVFSDNVLEHLKDPAGIFREVKRVLKQGGLFIVKTPNLYNFIILISRLTPFGLHYLYKKWFYSVRVNTFPAFYRANTKKTIAALAGKAGLKIESFQYVEGRPEYLRISPVTYLFGILFERAVNKIKMLSNLRILMYIVLKKV